MMEEAPSSLVAIVMVADIKYCHPVVKVVHDHLDNAFELISFCGLVPMSAVILVVFTYTSRISLPAWYFRLFTFLLDKNGQ